MARACATARNSSKHPSSDIVRPRQRAQELRQLRPLAKVLHVDETGHHENGHKLWTWCFREHGESYFRFITTPWLEPTNNLAEQAIRFVVIDRLVTQGTRSEKGRQWCKRS